MGVSGIKCFKYISIFAASLLLVEQSFSADLPQDPIETVEPGHGWTGLYVGGFIGAGGIVNNVEFPALGAGNFNGIGGEGLFGGVMAGYNFQVTSNFVVGIEGEVGLTDLTTELNIPGLVSVEAQPEWTAAVSARLGWLPSADTMIYVLGGYSYADYNVDINPGGGGGGFSQDYHGLHIGTGMEARIRRNLTARVEYRYTQYGGEDWGTAGAIDIEPSSHTGRIGLAWNLFDYGPQGDSPVPGYSPESWTGIYVGLYGAAGAVVDNVEIPGLGAGNFNGIGGEGVAGGAMVGYDHQFGPNWVAGLQAELGLSDITTELNIPGLVSAEAGADWTASVSARLGWLARPETMLYVIGGYSYADVDVSVSGLGSLSDDFHGFHIGTGMETYLCQNLTARVEYRYTQYGGEDFGSGGALDIEPSSHSGRVGVAWKFGG